MAEEPKQEKRGVKRARKQADEMETPIEVLNGGMYNIWYNKVVGDYTTWRERRDQKIAASKYRCVPSRDCGETKARKDSYVCLYFARGKCVLGGDCTFFHRLPNEEDEKRIGLAYDIFGRERHRTDRDDMGGVGSFERNSRTLYLGGLRITSGTNTEDVVRKYFGEFGTIEFIRIVPSKSIGFVTYSLRVSAEFAKEAMADQTLDSSEVINVRWANEDPNPAAKAGREQELLDKAMAALSTRFPDYYKYFLSLNANGQYPNTEQQYAAAEDLLQKAEQAQKSMVSQQQAYDPNAYYQYYYNLGYLWDPTTNSWTTHDGTAVAALPNESNEHGDENNNGEHKENDNKDEDSDGKVSGSGFLSQYYSENYGEEDNEENKDSTTKTKTKSDPADQPLYPATAADPAAMDKPLY
eukprot:TRINITY_DN1460_c0_g1_i1.p1 TRINITY_DN1460_c0_g1~~TRINITY_DN1460_c0_g1_i1.p1  ORF type:complete len:425 (-),score=90.87 TRINITY_DN1460_c0_g1_i1:30-1259(-)